MSTLNKARWLGWLAPLTLALSASGVHAADDVTVAYQTTVEPAKVAQADGEYEKSHAQQNQLAQVRERRGSDRRGGLRRCASGLCRFQPLAAAASRGLPVETFF